MIEPWIIWIVVGLSCFSIFGLILATDPQIQGKKRFVYTLFFICSIPIIAIMLGTYLS